MSNKTNTTIVYKSSNDYSTKSTSNIHRNESVFARSKNTTKFELNVLSESTPLKQKIITHYTPSSTGKNLSNAFYIFPAEVWRLIFNYCGTQTLILLKSVSKGLLREINKFKSLAEAQQHAKILIENNKSLALDQTLCRSMGGYNQETGQTIINFNLDLSPQEILGIQPTANPLNAAASFLRNILSSYACILIIGMILMFIIWANH